MHVNVKNLVGDNAMTLNDGNAIYEKIYEHLKQGQTIDLDFDGVIVFAAPFFNASVGHLLSRHQSKCVVHPIKN